MHRVAMEDAARNVIPTLMAFCEIEKQSDLDVAGAASTGGKEPQQLSAGEHDNKCHCSQMNL